ncbi:sensor histidine kinase [Streptococcus gallolyticus]|uniref:sensor histidine kinase n=3 Tax=Streptococcus gallolyticus TaxID=315405 RepID=UPI000777F5E8|nr:GHKL domain-containing protein [Streptococcus gallolyticus]MCY7191724.1 GHKL domain-containing protein [Streptococcus gallolyticus subsp. gallolyticus]
MSIEIICSEVHFWVMIILYLLLYQQISGIKFQKRWFIIIPLVFRILFLIVPILGYFGSLLFLVIYSLYKNYYQNRLLDIFYGFYPIIIESLFSKLFTHFIFPLFGISFDIVSNNYILLFIVELLIYPIYYLLIRVLKVDFSCLQKSLKKQNFNPFLWLVDITMVVYFCILQLLMIFDVNFNSFLSYRKLLVGIYLILFFMMLIYINGTCKEKLEQEVLEQKDRQLADLSNYNKQIEHLYKEIKNFRHDYVNILSSIKTGIDNRDIDAISDVYQKVLAKSGQRIQGNRYNITNLINVENEAIKSVLSAKVLEAQDKGININIEVGDSFVNPKIDLLDFVTILSILIDNAIEGVQPDSNHSITVALIAGEEDALIVENTTLEEKIDISQIYSYGFSTKGTDRGIGLSNVIHILDNYPNVTLQTQSSHHIFKQTLKMK